VNARSSTVGEDEGRRQCNVKRAADRSTVVRGSLEVDWKEVEIVETKKVKKWRCRWESMNGQVNNEHNDSQSPVPVRNRFGDQRPKWRPAKV